MRITKQPSGGRGEYELSEYAPNGLSPIDLLDKEVRLQLNSLTIRTSVQLTKSQGKYRLRVKPKGAYPQVQIQIANVLMMPDPGRDEQQMAGGELVLQNDSYVIKNINFGEVNAESGGDFFIAQVLTIDCENQTIKGEQIPVVRRINDIERIWQKRANFPSPISDLLQQHEELVRGGGPIGRNASRLIKNLQSQMEIYSPEVEIPYTRTTDVVPALLAAIQDIIEEMPISLDQIEPEQIDLRRREIRRWRQYVRRRGASSVKFKKDVREAYNSRCIMCGSRFPSTQYNTNPGVDAAHILPWAVFDLDKTYNGLALCKIHHWAFDEGLLLITYRDGAYYITLSEEAANNLSEPEFSIDALRQVVGRIPEERLPSDRNNRPYPNLLQRLNNELV